MIMIPFNRRLGISKCVLTKIKCHLNRIFTYTLFMKYLFIFFLYVNGFIFSCIRVYLITKIKYITLFELKYINRLNR